MAGKPRPGQRQPALLTTQPSLSAEQAAGLLRSRRTQESFFKYLRAEFGLDTLPKHALVKLDADAWVVNPAWREIDKALKKQRNSVGHLRHKRALEPDARSAKARALDAQIQACDRAIEGLARARQAADHQLRAGQLSESERLQALPQPLRMLMGTLRMTPAIVLLRTAGQAHADGAKVRIATARRRRLRAIQGDRSTTI